MLKPSLDHWSAACSEVLDHSCTSMPSSAQRTWMQAVFPAPGGPVSSRIGALCCQTNICISFHVKHTNISHCNISTRLNDNVTL